MGEAMPQNADLWSGIEPSIIWPTDRPTDRLLMEPKHTQINWNKLIYNAKLATW